MLQLSVENKHLMIFPFYFTFLLPVCLPSLFSLFLSSFLLFFLFFFLPLERLCLENYAKLISISS